MAEAPLLLAFQAMGGPCEIRLDEPGGRAALRHAAEQARQEVQRIEQAYSRYRSDSVIARINAAAGRGAGVQVNAETAALLDFCATLHAQSDGLFDATSGVLRRAWDFRSGRLPKAAEVQALLPLVGWQRVHWDGQVFALPEPGMELDFGGIGKEYAADRAAALLQSLGQRHGWVNLGGDIRIVGPRPDGRPWLFGVRHPRRPDTLLAELSLSDGALATSGDYERFIEHDGRRYCHILDPRSGWPAAHWQSVSVVAPTCAAAGALTTLAMLHGPDAPAFLDGQGVDYLAVDAAGQLHSRSLRTQPSN